MSYCRALANQKKIFKKARRESFIKYISELKFDSPLNLVWDRIRKLQGKFVPSPLPILNVAGSVISDPKEVADMLGRHFASVSSAAHYSQAFQRVRVRTVVVPLINTASRSYNLDFNLEELNHALSLSSETSPGEDDISYSMISNLQSSS